MRALMQGVPTGSAATAPRATVRLRGDKLGRLMLVVVAALMIWLVSGPTTQYFHTRTQATQTQNQLRTLEREQRRLSAESAALSHGSGLEQQARRQGLIKPSERAYVIESPSAGSSGR